MLLRTRFIVLIALLSVAVAGVLASVSWSAWLLKHEVTDPHRGTTRVLLSVERANQAIASIREALSQPAGSAGGGIHDLTENLQAEVNVVINSTDAPTRGGAVSVRTMRASLAELRTGAAMWSESGEEQPRRAALDALARLSDILRLVGSRALDDSALAVENGEQIGQRLVLIAGLVFLTVALVSALSLALFQRWVSRPIARLRGAAEQMGRGDLTVRVPVHGSDELSQLSDTVNHMASTIERMQEERVQRERLAAVGELLRRLSHNLRNPLAGIRGVAEISSRRERTNERLREDMSRIIRSVDRLDEWLSDLLTTTSPVELNASEHRIDTWLRDLLVAHEPTAESKSVSLRLDVEGAPPIAVFDKRHMEQAMTALVTNAIQATPSEGSVTIEARRDEDESWWELIVRDTGPGVPEEIREQIFTPHFTTKPDGTGLGLAMAQQVVTRHGGDLRVRDHADSMDSQRPPIGAEFVIRLPMRPPTSAPQVNGASRGEGSRRRG